MRGLVGLLLVAVAVGSLFVPAGTPALEAAYILTGDRFLQAYHPYRDLAAPLDLPFLYAHAFLGAEGGWLLRLWKAMGGMALALFFGQSQPRAFSSIAAQLLTIGGIGLYLFLPWQSSFEVGEPALWLLLLWNRKSGRSFLRGILTGIGIGLFPAAALSVIWTVYRRVEERNFSSLLLWGAGMGWAALGLAAGLHLQKSLGPYIEYFWMGSWRSISWPGIGAWVGRGVGILLLLAYGQMYFRQSYMERQLFRDRLWAAIAALPTSAAASVWPALAMEVHWRLGLRFFILVLLVVEGLLKGEKILSRPSCMLSIEPQSCLWGEPPCYIRLKPPYACNWTVPFKWKEHAVKPDWELFYDRWGKPKRIYDAAGFWAEAQYFLPYLAAPYAPVDTALPFRVYQRR
ncbi:MAG: hypothetical protein NZ989_06660 [Bacteroidia bacterium]|nr:hypothetical protein [Bacteroidia bacterium]MDW8058049.1 hypothetical protein [Bacteroidia bacterium]